MPLYEYRCIACRRKATLFFRSFDSVEDDPACPYCRTRGMQRLVSRFWSHRSTARDEGWDDEWSDADAGFEDDQYGDMLDADGDPVEFARQARQMAAEFGESLEPELDVALRRIESGADPEDVLGELEHTEAAVVDAREDDGATDATES